DVEAVAGLSPPKGEGSDAPPELVPAERRESLVLSDEDGCQGRGICHNPASPTPRLSTLAILHPSHLAALKGHPLRCLCIICTCFVEQVVWVIEPNALASKSDPLSGLDESFGPPDLLLKHGGGKGPVLQVGVGKPLVTGQEVVEDELAP